MLLEFSQVRDVANVISLSRFLNITPRQFLAAHLLDALDGFQHRNAVLASAAEVVDLAGPRIRGKFLDCPNHVVAVDVVAHLFAFVAKNGIRAAAERHLYEIRQESMKLHAGVRRSGQAAAAKNSDVHLEITSVFLCNQVRGGLRRSEKGMQRVINPAVFTDTLIILGSRIVITLLKFL